MFEFVTCIRNAMFGETENEEVAHERFMRYCEQENEKDKNRIREYKAKYKGYSIHTIDNSRFDYNMNSINIELSSDVSTHDNDENHQPDRIAIIFRKFMAKHPGGVGKKKVEE